MSFDPEFLSLEDVKELHRLSLERFRGSDGIRSDSLLESATYQAQSGFGGEFLHPTLYDMAAAYAFHLAENQPFVDGNKRTALLSAMTFLRINGIRIDQPTDELYQAMIRVAEKKLDKNGLAELFRRLAERESG
ncbi:MAG: type II toxin-antitoxin system death-on-curing family toxin [Candidatus Omnitrophica bacterium]|nr:type II toxin-antitoxin system death-on-curing family toxin [Candidatus Omnitrophota bacterium]